ncbi:hypothetical protein TeGR_g5838, partial [Tetraparma gracilis]
PVQERVGSVFIFTTMLTVMLATKKVVSFRGLGDKKRNLERLEREIQGLEEEAGGWLAELVRMRSGGEEPPREETRAPDETLAQQVARLTREKREEKERADRSEAALASLKKTI